ncbi:MAG: CRISPR-associated helicase Cas3', partial [Sciscionella sp.]
METPYPYQLRAYEAIKRGRSIIIQAPTGAGKTRAALYPYFANLKRAEHLTDTQRAGLSLPLTCRYAVPMRVLATQFQREYSEHFARLDQSRGTRFNDTYSKLGISLPAIQTGEAPEDTLFESPLTFCTIDQLLASFIGAPYSVSPRQANLNVGAIVGSYLILDEFHLYPVEKGNGARLTSLAMLRMLRQFSPFVLMTATLSTKFLAALAEQLDADVIQVDSEELRTIHAGRARTLFRSEAPMTADTIIERHADAHARGMGASLVVCNTVARAQNIYLELRKVLSGNRDIPPPQVMLLHSRFTSEDRRAKSERLETWLGKETWGSDAHPNVIVVATQVVEVGLNISAGVLHTELAPANALIQRFGRCARFAQQQGDVAVYPIPAGDNGKVLYLPYDAKLCEATWNYLEQLLPDAADGTSFGFAEEQKLIDAV